MSMARYSSNPAVLMVLIKDGADVNAKDTDGLIPLMSAARYNSNPAVLMVLIKAGADVNAKDTDGLTPLMSAAKDHNPDGRRYYGGLAEY